MKLAKQATFKERKHCFNYRLKIYEDTIMQNDTYMQMQLKNR